MAQVISDIVDVYVFRRLNARVQFLLLQRRSDVALPHTWQAFHSQIHVGTTTLQTVEHAVHSLSGLNVSAIYSADYVNQFYDENRDALILAPVFAVNVSPQAPIDLGNDYRDAAWFDRDEATARLPFSGQRWAIRHIDEIMSLGEAETGIYRIDMNTVQPVQRNPERFDDIDDDDSLQNERMPPTLSTDAVHGESELDLSDFSDTASAAGNEASPADKNTDTVP